MKRFRRAVGTNGRFLLRGIGRWERGRVVRIWFWERLGERLLGASSGGGAAG